MAYTYATLGLPLFLEDTSGFITGPTDFLDIYDRPPFVCVENAMEIAARRTTVFVFDKRRHRNSGVTLVFEPGLRCSVTLGKDGRELDIQQWLRNVGPLLRRFRGSDGELYEWSHKGPSSHEWSCVQLGSNLLVAHYDLKSKHEPRYRTSGNVLTVYERWSKLSVELVASLIAIRHVHAIGGK
ncbi:hypothetical protein BU17DRAFT_89356 [Hysterangium stoloniferum]|nr:hypothetical protein BU17DRAFT_89356 [Hysterangium stoloniferum]